MKIAHSFGWRRSCQFFVLFAVFAVCVHVAPFSLAQPAAPTAAERAEGEKEPFTGAFSNGVKIELVGVSVNPSKGQPWWTPDGKFMSKPPFAMTPAQVQPGQGEKKVGICWRWLGLPPAQASDARWEVIPAPKARQEILPVDADGNRLADVNAAVVTVSKDADCTIRFSLPVQGATGHDPAQESVEFRQISLVGNTFQRVDVVRIAADGKEVRLPAAGMSKELIDEERTFLKAVQERRAKLQALLKTLPEQKEYQLAEGERFKHVPPPFSAAHEEVFAISSALASGLDAGGQLQSPGSGYLLLKAVSGGLQFRVPETEKPTIARILDRVFKISSHRIEGGETLLTTELPGDWVLTWDPNRSRFDDPTERYVATAEDIERLERIIQEELLIVADLELREVKRPVYVVKGTYNYARAAAPDGKTRDSRSDWPDNIKLLAGSRNIRTSMVSFPDLLERIGEFLKVPLVDETSTKPTKPQTELQVFGSLPADAKPLDQATIDAVVAGLATQTGYTFVKEERPVKVLFIKDGNN